MIEMNKTHCFSSRAWQLNLLCSKLTVFWHSKANVNPKLTKNSNYSVVDT